MNYPRLFLTFIFIFFIAFLSYALLFHKKNDLPSALLNENIPSFQLPDLMEPQKIFTQVHLKGEVSLLNIWATWCTACEIEHGMLLKISEQYHIPIYGIAYKDNRLDAIHFLKTNGNPYRLVGDDKTGDTVIDFGVYGTPETFVINPDGQIVYRHVGVITEEIWENMLYPIVEKYKK